MIPNLDTELAFSVVKSVIDAHDPESLLKLGSPADEYDPECREIVKAMGREGPCTPEGFARIIRVALFHSFQAWSFDDLPDLQYYMGMGAQLWSSLPVEYRA